MLFYPVGANKPIRVQGSCKQRSRIASGKLYQAAERFASYSPDILEEIVTEHEFTSGAFCCFRAIETVLDADNVHIHAAKAFENRDTGCA